MRPDKNLYFMRMARLVATRSTCLRRAVGCVLVDERYHVLSTGYNGVARGEEHCNFEQVENPSGNVIRYSYPHACPGANLPSGTGLNQCAAVHAEQNCLCQCRDPFAIHTAYVTVAPCDSCLKLFLNTSCKVIMVGGWYHNADGLSNEAECRARWEHDLRAVVLDLRE